MNDISSTVATLWRYPVKSMMGEELTGSHIDVSGLLADRCYALIDGETEKVVSAKNPKKWPDFFSYKASYIDPPTTGNLPPVRIMLPDGSWVRSDDDDANSTLSKALGHAVALKTHAPDDAKLEQYWPEFAGETNEISNEAVAADAKPGTFFDYSPLHLLTTASLEALQSLYPRGRIEVRRFRPNIVVETSGLNGFVENDWVGKVVRLGRNVRLQITDPCPRCVMPTLAQGDLPADPGLFKQAIAKNRILVPFANKELPCIGVYARVLTAGWVKRGDVVKVEG